MQYTHCDHNYLGTMKTFLPTGGQLGRAAFLLTVLIALLLSPSHSNANSTESVSCNLIAMIADGTDLQVKCETDGFRVLSLDNSNLDFQELLDSGKIHSSGFHVLFEGAYIDGHTLVIPSSAEFSFQSEFSVEDGIDLNRRHLKHQRRRLPKDASGSQKVLVVYVKDATGSTPTRPMSGGTNSVQDDIFGSHGDSLNLANAFESCSNGFVDFEPFEGTTLSGVEVTNGIHEVQISITVSNGDVSEIELAAVDAANAVFGNLKTNVDSNIFDYVIICLPPGASISGASWLAYAYLNYWLGIYNDEACSSASILVHEIGHNLNLGHAGYYATTQSAAEYRDLIGYMGFSTGVDSGGDDRPIKCFNGPKTYQLGWFPTFHKDLTFPNYSWIGNLYGFVDVNNIAANETQKMIIKLESTSTDLEDFVDYYVSFNRKSGANIDTEEAEDKVVVHASQKIVGRWGPKSDRKAILSAGETAVVTVSGIEITITCIAIDLSSSPPFAAVQIQGGITSAPSLSSSPSLSSLPSLTPIARIPSSSPSELPTGFGGSVYSIETSNTFGLFQASSKSGVMFDISTTEDILIRDLEISLFYPGPPFDTDTDIELWVKDGSYVGSEQNTSGQWTKHLDTTKVQGPTTSWLVKLTIPPLYILAGTTKGIFLTNIDAKNFINIAQDYTALSYSDGTVTIPKGRISKYAYFLNNSSWNPFDYVPHQFAGVIYYQKTGNLPTSTPSRLPSDVPSLSFQPSLSMVPSARPSESTEPSLKPSTSPSVKPSISVAPSLEPSTSPSVKPSISLKPSSFPTMHPSLKPSNQPSNQPSSSRPTKKPTSSPTGKPSPKPSTADYEAPSQKPSLTLKPSAGPSDIPSSFPSDTPKPSAIVSALPSAVESSKPSKPLFQIVVTSCKCQSPFYGISQSELSNRFAVIIALWEKAITAKLGPDKSKWKTRITKVGNRDVRRNLLGSGRLLEDNVVDVEFELTKETICTGVDGCGEEEESTGVQEGLAVLANLETAISSGALTTTIVAEAAAAGLDELSGLSVLELDAEDPTTEVIDPSAYPSATATSSPSLSPAPSSFPTINKSCKDSPIKFNIKWLNAVLKETCDWVSESPDIRCLHDGVPTHCPNTCETCDICTDSTNQLNFRHNNKKLRKTCDWVARSNTEERCAIDGMADTCRATCETCCSDNDEKFEFEYNGKNLNKSCDWVARTNTEARCKVITVAANCPLTCNTCGCSNVEGKFPFTYKGKILSKSCEWAGRIEVEKVKRCAVPTVASRCPLTCSTCGTCTDAQEMIEFTFQGKTIKRNCEWAGRVKAQKGKRCAVPFVASSCPLTCDSCGCKDVTEKFTFEKDGNTIEKNCAWVGRAETEKRCEIATVASKCPLTCGKCS